MTESKTESRGSAGHGDLHFDQVVVLKIKCVCYKSKIVNEIRDIQMTVDNLLFGSVFLRKPRGVPEGVAGRISHMHSLDDRLKELLENKDNECFADQIDEYLRELEDSERTLIALIPVNIEKIASQLNCLISSKDA
uniref:FIP-RBD domain-containing protein n=1 Tax=Meloidogyne hapla TaxID=6305 RepID=A0A1I8BPX3_MELHA